MKKKKGLYRSVTFLTREELDCLDGIIKDIYFSEGIKIPRAALIEQIIKAFKDNLKDKQRVERDLVKKVKKGGGSDETKKQN